MGMLHPIRVWEFPDQYEFEGMTLTLSDQHHRGKDIRTGDMYLAGRNTGPHLLTCKEVKNGVGEGWINSKENAYPFDIYECRKVLAIDGKKEEICAAE